MPVTNNVALAVGFLAQTDATLTRAGGSYVNGRWVRVVQSTATIKVHHQPVSGQDLLRLPEGERTQEMKSVWTVAALRTADPDAGLEADVLSFAGKHWKVILLLDRQEYGSYTKAIVSRSDVV